MSQITVEKLSARFTKNDEEVQVNLFRDVETEKMDVIYGLHINDGREIYLYEEEIELAHQMLQKLKELNSKD